MPAVYNGCRTVPEVGSSKATLGNFEGRYPRGNALFIRPVRYLCR